MKIALVRRFEANWNTKCVRLPRVACEIPNGMAPFNEGEFYGY
jgi:hypothetical protein